jgi:hypothetical protein
VPERTKNGSIETHKKWLNQNAQKMAQSKRTKNGSIALQNPAADPINHHPMGHKSLETIASVKSALHDRADFGREICRARIAGTSERPLKFAGPAEKCRSEIRRTKAGMLLCSVSTI